MALAYSLQRAITRLYPDNYGRVDGRLETHLIMRVLIDDERIAVRIRLTGGSSQSRSLRLATRDCDVCSVDT